LPRPRTFTAAIHELAALSDPACLLDHDGIILFVNDAWERLGEACGAGQRCGAGALVGTRWLDAIHGEGPRHLHAVLLHRALRRAGDGPGGAVVHASEANDTRTARLVSARISPVAMSPGAPAGVSIVHRVVRELPIGEVYAVVERPEAAYRDAAGDLEQCGCCRRTRRPDAPDEWDLVPALLERAPRGARYGYCPLCLELHCAGGV
ncbi:MAG TPA: PAS domain-containing protein, partial [Polyangiaceae bacterium]|nr:PAS domain-containing protein [Polyangiaceae bacterium]